METILTSIDQLIAYGRIHHLFPEADCIYVRNTLLDIFHLHTYEEIPSTTTPTLYEILDTMLAYAIQEKLIEDTQDERDRFDTRIMNALLPPPSSVINNFQEHYKESPKKATDAYFHMSQASNYIRCDRIKKNKVWVTNTKYGDIDITINLSKPEKDPKDIAKAKSLPTANYPKCLLCKENEGFVGYGNLPARNNHRLIPVLLNNTTYHLQYSPYSYYNEHCIVFNDAHIPMKINRDTFTSLLDFVERFPHYFLGSNADLPIVGGSILTHDHFQGGAHDFAMAKAPMLEQAISKQYPDVTYGRLHWPLSVIRLCGTNKASIIALADTILKEWKTYNNPSLNIIAFDDTTPHNTITPIARMKDNHFELDLTLRNNGTNDKYPDGIFHPHPQYHHIKKENIGLIEVMGLAVLPARLQSELAEIEQCIINNLPLPTSLQHHEAWFQTLTQRFQTLNATQLQDAIQNEIGHLFIEILENSGVFKQDKQGQNAFSSFIEKF